MQVSLIMMLCWEVIIYQMMWSHITTNFTLKLHSENLKMVFVHKSSCRTSLWLLYGLHYHINHKPFSHPLLKIYRPGVSGCPSSGTKNSYCPWLDKTDEKNFSFDKFAVFQQMITFISVSFLFLTQHYWHLLPFLLITLWCRCINHNITMCCT
jgi:hypothetical protein